VFNVRRSVTTIRRVLGPDVAAGLLAAGVAFLAVAASVSFDPGRLSVLVHMSSTEPMARVARTDAHFAFVGAPAHYDGVYFYAIALDPIATDKTHGLIDRAAYRYGHPAYGWLAAILSLGRQELLPLALLLLGLGGMFVAGVATSRLWTAFGRSPWGGFVVFLNPGLIYAVTADTSEALGAALLMTGLLAWTKGHLRTAAAVCVLLCFTKEVLVLVPLALMAWETVRWLRGRTPAYLQRMGLLAIGPVLYALWYVYLDATFGTWPFQGGQDVLSWPLVGWLDSLGKAASMAKGAEFQLGQAAVPLLTVGLVALLLGVVRAARLRSSLDAVYLAMAGLVLSVGWLALLFPKDLVRTIALPLLVLPLVLFEPAADVDLDVMVQPRPR
jgi:hypothetical protein